jgi:tetratricopeptide (TPR) repeat protein
MKKLAVLLLATSAAYAQPQKPDKATRAKATAMYEQGSAHYEAGRFSEAIPLFKDAYELVHDPVYLFNLAQSYRKVLDCVAATEYYERFLEEAKDADPKQRERVQGWVRELAPCVDDRKRDAEAARRGQEAAEAAERARQSDVARPAPKPAYKTVDHGQWLRIGGYIAAGAGAVGIVLGVRYSIRGSNIEDELDKQCAIGCDWTDPALREKDEAGKRANTLSKITWIGGGVALAGGVALYFIGRSRVEQVQVNPVDGGATVSARVTF